ncbi:YdcF family protein [Lachnospiraceae bacterium OttesenSCG-928-D06]|nr:YdcF family protein [Lachnospiraceae bacterium OttesenSCG-928-D06]
MREKRKKELIPIEKSKRVIHLEKRGRRQLQMSIGSMILIILGVLAFIYSLAMGIFYGSGTKFFIVWAVCGFLCIGLGYLTGFTRIPELIPIWLRNTMIVVLCLFLLFFFVIEGMIFSKFQATISHKVDYLIVLGAQLKDSGPSVVLKQRLDTAVVYLQENEECLVIVSGGQGPNEPKAEALGMYDYLIEAGIEESRILIEGNSKNTDENLEFSYELIGDKDAAVAIVTSDFHILRATLIGKKTGFTQISGLAAASTRGALGNNMLREFFGIIKDFLVGNL